MPVLGSESGGLVEGVVIVGSILLAFGIQGWAGGASLYRLTKTKTSPLS